MAFASAWSMGSLIETLVIVILLLTGLTFFFWLIPARCSHSVDARFLVCSTSHTRFFPVRHSFTYPLLYVFFRIDRVASNIFFGIDKFRIFHVRSDDYLGSPPCGTRLIEKLRWHLKEHGIFTSTSMNALMLTMPRFFGYSFNPLTTYYVYDHDNLIAIVLEVHNTFGEKHIYVAPYSPASQSVSRRFHVSPFNDRLGTYQLKVMSPEHGISIRLTLITPEARTKLVATLRSVSEAAMTDSTAVLSLCISCGWWIFLTFPRILFEAWKLHYRKGLPVFMRPEPFHERGTVKRQTSNSTDLYFKALVIRYLQFRSEKITFNMLSPNTLVPDVIEVNPPAKQTITVLADSFFTNLVCNESLEGLFIENVIMPDVSRFELFVKGLGFCKWCEYKYMSTKAKFMIWMEREFFRQIATFHDDNG